MKLTAQMIQWEKEGVSYREMGRRLKLHSKTILKAFGRVKDTRKICRVKAMLQPAPPETKGGGLRGFTVNQSTRVSENRPAATIRSRFYDLQRGLAYPVAEAAREWGCSTETLRKHARDVNCFFFVEMDNEQWVPCVFHPDTAKQYQRSP